MLARKKTKIVSLVQLVLLVTRIETRKNRKRKTKRESNELTHVLGAAASFHCIVFFSSALFCFTASFLLLFSRCSQDKVLPAYTIFSKRKPKDLKEKQKERGPEGEQLVFVSFFLILLENKERKNKKLNFYLHKLPQTGFSSRLFYFIPLGVGHG